MRTAAVDFDECTCLAVTGGSGTDTTRGAVNLPTPTTGTYTFNAGSVTGIFGVVVQASDIRAKVTRTGTAKTTVTDEKTKAADVEGGEVTLDPNDTDEVEATTTVARFTVTVGLAKWPCGGC